MVTRLVVILGLTGLGATLFAAPVLRPASRAEFPQATDSNSPGHWDGGRLYLFNSTGQPYRSYGSNIFQLGNSAAVSFNNTVNGGRWMEATWRATMLSNREPTGAGFNGPFFGGAAILDD